MTIQELLKTVTIFDFVNREIKGQCKARDFHKAHDPQTG